MARTADMRRSMPAKLAVNAAGLFIAVSHGLWSFFEGLHFAMQSGIYISSCNLIQIHISGEGVLGTILQGCHYEKRAC